MQQTLRDWTVTRNYRRFMMMSTNIFPLMSNKLVSYRILPGGGGGGGVPNKVFFRDAPPKGATPYPLYTIFDRKDVPFVYLPLTNDTPLSHT